MVSEEKKDSSRRNAGNPTNRRPARTTVAMVVGLSLWAWACSALNLGTNCFKDNDCTGDEVCINGTCVISWATDDTGSGSNELESDTKPKQKHDSEEIVDPDAGETSSDESTDESCSDTSDTMGGTDSSSQFELRIDSPQQNATPYRLQPVTFSGYASGSLEIRTKDDVLIGETNDAGDFSFEYAFQTEGEQEIRFLHSGEVVETLSLTVMANRAKICIDPGWLNATTSDSEIKYQAILNRKVGFYLETLFHENGFDTLTTTNDIPRDEIFAAGFDNEGADEQEKVGVRSLQDRVEMCNTWDADYFITVLHNSLSDKTHNGIVTVYAEQELLVPYNEVCRTWAQNTAKALQTVMGDGSTPLGYRAVGDIEYRSGSTFYVLQETTMPALLTAASFYSNPEERVRLNKNDYLQGEAEAIFEGFIETFY
jgi:N-acetylmuramoyl-L-alanine amidase